MERITPENITDLKENEVFVFGSNEAGIHGAGAAKTAKVRFGAKDFKGFGYHSTPIGLTFAIPTKDWEIKTLHPFYIHAYIHRFIDFAKYRKDLKFLVTELGCGLAGYTPEDIAPMFKEALELENVYLPKRFIEQLNKTK